jgi:ElaB/YqjD/DUF883 family membrane-anchored ribosome-binding protein
MADAAENNVTPISADSKLNDEQKREQLRDRIEAGEKRNEARSLADQAKDAADSAVEFTKKHPFAVIGGMTRPGRRLGRRGGTIAAIAADAALAYGARMIDSMADGAQFAGDRLEDLGDSAATTARGLRRDAAYKLDVAGDALRSSSRKAGRKSSRAYRALRTGIKH